MPGSVVKADGNIRIPASLRKSVGATPGQKFDAIAKGRTIVLVPAVDVRTLPGSARGADTSDYRDFGPPVVTDDPGIQPWADPLL